MINTHTEPLAFDKKTAAKRLGLAQNTVQKLLEQGELRGRKVGSRWVISARAIAEFLGDEKAPAGKAGASGAAA